MNLYQSGSPTSVLNKAVLIRVDSSTRIGTGHAMRCLTLANQLREHGRVVTFVARAHPGNINRKIKGEGFELLELPASSQDNQNLGDSDYAAWLGVSQEQDQLETLRAIGDRKFEWLVIDHYALDAAWESPMREVARKIMVIDDLANRQHDCDVLLDQNFYLDAQTRYQNLVSPTATCLLGPEYALLRPEFYEAQANLRERNGEVKRVLVCMGGSDPDNVTGKVVEALKDEAFSHLDIDVVVGPSNPHVSSITSQIAGRANFHFLRDAPNMAQLIADADLAVGAAGSMTWERASLRLPSISIPIAANQATRSIHLGAEVPNFEFPKEGLSDLRKVRRTICDVIRKLELRPLGISRNFECKNADNQPMPKSILLGDLSGLELEAHWAGPEDELLLWELYSDLEARSSAVLPYGVSLDSHKRWFRQVLEKKKAVQILVFRNKLGPLGHVRIDETFLGLKLDYAITRQYRGCKLASEMLRVGLRMHSATVTDLSLWYFAEVRLSNIASLRALKSVGFSVSDWSDNNRITHNVDFSLLRSPVANYR